MTLNYINLLSVIISYNFHVAISVVTDHITHINGDTSLSNDDNKYSYYYDYINDKGHVKLSCAQSLRLPGRIREIEAHSIDNESN